MTSPLDTLRIGVRLELVTDAWNGTTETVTGEIVTYRRIGGTHAVVQLREDRGGSSFFTIAADGEGLRLIAPPAVDGEAMRIAAAIVAGQRPPVPESRAIQTLAAAVLARAGGRAP